MDEAQLESRLLGEINNLRHAEDTTLMAESEEEPKSLLMRVKEESKNQNCQSNPEETNKTGGITLSDLRQY